MTFYKLLCFYIFFLGLAASNSLAVEIEDALDTFLEKANRSPSPEFISACSVENDKWVKDFSFLIYIFHEDNAGVFGIGKNGISGFIAGEIYSKEFPRGVGVDIQGGVGSAILAEEIMDHLKNLPFVRLSKPSKEQIISIARKTKCEINHDKIEEYYKGFEK